MSYQYVHRRYFSAGGMQPKGGCTFAIEQMSAEAFDHLSKNSGSTVSLRIGLAMCSTKDNYNKRLGRTISRARAENQLGLFKVDRADTLTTFSQLILTEVESKLTVVLIKNTGSSKVQVREVL